MTYKLTDGRNVELNVSALDDHELAKLEKQFKRRDTGRKQIESSSNTDNLNVSQIDPKDLERLERHLQREAFERKHSPRKIDTGKIDEDEWRDVFDMPDFLRHPNSQGGKGGTIDFPFIPANYFRHARISLRNKLKKSKLDRKEILDEFFAAAASDNILQLQGMRLELDKASVQSLENRSQESFILNFGTMTAVKERKERHLMGLFEAMSRIENIPVTIGQVGQLNLAGNQQVNNDRQKPPATDIEAEDAS
ncbi:MAG: hypothetical protein WAX69_01615 [Victivallales bacterium]